MTTKGTREMNRRTILALSTLALALTAAVAGCGGEKSASGEATPQTTVHPDGTREMFVRVDEKGYDPMNLTAPAGSKVRVTFKRTSDAGCGQQVAFPSLKIQKDLPLNQPVSVDLTMPPSGSLGFQCGMGMYKGAVVVQ